MYGLWLLNDVVRVFSLNFLFNNIYFLLVGYVFRTSYVSMFYLYSGFICYFFIFIISLFDFPVIWSLMIKFVVGCGICGFLRLLSLVYNSLCYLFLVIWVFYSSIYALIGRLYFLLVALSLILSCDEFGV